jgi:outer membrane protein OmpA-like peptidoglycan-associated protein
MNRQRLGIFLIVAVATASRAAPAGADGLDGQRFVPAAGAAGGFNVERTLVLPHLDWGVGLFLHYADDPVVVLDTGSGAVVARPLERALTLDLLGSVGLWDFAELAVHLPVDLVYEGEDVVAGGQALAASTGVGDLRLMPKFRLLAGESFGVGLAVPIRLPTGDDAALRGAGDVTVEPKLLLSWWAGRVSLGANVGYRLHTSDEGRQGPGGDELSFGGLLRYRLPFAGDSVVLSAELVGGLETDSDDDQSRNLPMEALLGAIVELSPSWQLYFGGGAGVHDGVGTPDFRLVFGIRYTSVGFSDRDRDGIYDERDRCPDSAEDMDDFEDEDGCPDRDNDSDGIIDDEDECPDAAEDPGGRDNDGCPERGHAEYRRGRIKVLGKVRFKTNSAELEDSSDPILDDVAREMKRHPEVHKVRVEGHSDNVGDREYNRKLSRERAISVRAALIRRGVKPGRLEAAGYGETRPIATNRTERGRGKNRRVEFEVVK